MNKEGTFPYPFRVWPIICPMMAPKRIYFLLLLLPFPTACLAQDNIVIDNSKVDKKEPVIDKKVWDERKAERKKKDNAFNTKKKYKKALRRKKRLNGRF